MRRKIGGAMGLGLVPGAVVLVLAASAQAKIVVGVGMAGIKLGDSEAQVMTTLGAPAYKTPEGKVTSRGPRTAGASGRRTWRSRTAHGAAVDVASLIARSR